MAFRFTEAIRDKLAKHAADQLKLLSSAHRQDVRLVSIRLFSYGPLQDATIQLNLRLSDSFKHVLIGTNGTGKSTALCALRNLFLGLRTGTGPIQEDFPVTEWFRGSVVALFHVETGDTTRTVRVRVDTHYPGSDDVEETKRSHGWMWVEFVDNPSFNIKARPTIFLRRTIC